MSGVSPLFFRLILISSTDPVRFVPTRGLIPEPPPKATLLVGARVPGLERKNLLPELFIINVRPFRVVSKYL